MPLNSSKAYVLTESLDIIACILNSSCQEMYFNKQTLHLPLTHGVIQEAFCINGCHYWTCDWGDTFHYGQHGYLPLPWQMIQVISFLISLSLNCYMCQLGQHGLQLGIVFHCPPLAKMSNNTIMVAFTARHKINVIALSCGTFMILLF